MKLAILLARVRIESDECIRGAGLTPVFSEARQVLNDKSSMMSALHPILFAALTGLARTLKCEAIAFPELQPVIEIAPLMAAGGKTHPARAELPTKLSLKKVARILRLAGAATFWNGECLWVRASSMKERTLARILSSFAAHEAEHFRVRKIEIKKTKPEFIDPYTPCSFQETVRYVSMRSWIANHPNYDLWPIAKHEVQKLFGCGKSETPSAGTF